MPSLRPSSIRPRLPIRYATCLVTGAALLCLALPSAPARAAAHGTLVQVQVPSVALHGARATIIYLPPGYYDPANAARRYPVLYLLSGAPGSEKDWFHHGKVDATVDRLIAAHAISPVILVSPDGNGGPHRDSQFIDSYDGRERVETFISHDLVSYMDAFFRTIADAQGRALLGYSAGAYGALNIGLHHPDRFGTLAGFCGYYSADPKEVAHPALNNPFGDDPAVLARNDPSRTVVALPAGRRPHIFLFETTVDGHYTATTRAFDALLTLHHYPHVIRLYKPATAIERATWPHSWFFVRYAIADNLPSIVSAMAGGAP